MVDVHILGLLSKAAIYFDFLAGTTKLWKQVLEYNTFEIDPMSCRIYNIQAGGGITFKLSKST